MKSNLDLENKRRFIMSEFKAFDGGEPFLKPEKPFLLMFKDVLGRDNYEWFDDEEEFENRIKEVKSNPYPCTDIEAIEIGSYREIKVNKF